MSFTAPLACQARIIISPTPTTLVDSSAILSKLQSFGRVSAFLNPRYVAALKPYALSDNTILAIFNDEQSLKKAQAANPMEVRVGHDQADPRELDPFNVRGLRDRKPVKAKTFRCEISAETDSNLHKQIAQSNVYSGPFRVDRMTATTCNLRKQRAPLWELADSFQTEKMHPMDEARFIALATKYRFHDMNEKGELKAGLMDTWRSLVKRGGRYAEMYERFRSNARLERARYRIRMRKEAKSANMIWRSLPLASDTPNEFPSPRPTG